MCGACDVVVSIVKRGEWCLRLPVGSIHFGEVTIERSEATGKPLTHACIVQRRACCRFGTGAIERNRRCVRDIARGINHAHRQHRPILAITRRHLTFVRLDGIGYVLALESQRFTDTCDLLFAHAITGQTLACIEQTPRCRIKLDVTAAGLNVLDPKITRGITQVNATQCIRTHRATHQLIAGTQLFMCSDDQRLAVATDAAMAAADIDVAPTQRNRSVLIRKDIVVGDEIDVAITPDCIARCDSDPRTGLQVECNATIACYSIHGAVNTEVCFQRPRQRLANATSSVEFQVLGVNHRGPVHVDDVAHTANGTLAGGQ